MRLSKYGVNKVRGDYIADLQSKFFEVRLVRCTYDETVPVLDQLRCQVTLKVSGSQGGSIVNV